MESAEESWNHWVRGKVLWRSVFLDRAMWATRLWNDGILPELKEKGFILRLPKSKIIRLFLWFWKAIDEQGYMNPNNIPLPVPIVPIKVPRGEEHTLAALHRKKLSEYYSLFSQQFDYDFWKDIFNFYEGAFDESWTGRMLSSDLPNFVWAYVDLAQSAAIEAYEEEEAEAEAYFKQIESSHLTHEELDKMKKRGEFDPEYIYDKHS
jgi:hypothetical protein